MPNQPKMIETICHQCECTFSAPHYKVKKGFYKYCSKDCRYKYNRVTVSCSYCSADIKTTPSNLKKSKTGFHFCNNDCKYAAVASPKIKYSTGIPPKKTTKNTYRRHMLRECHDPKCIRCGYKEHIKLLDVDHIDGNRNNNNISNLQLLCVMCHAMKTRLPNLY